MKNSIQSHAAPVEPVIGHRSDAPVATAHTPGPWRSSREYEQDAHPAFVTGGNDWRPVADCAMGFDEDAANARLIAAAPDMLAALKECANRFSSTLDELKGLLADHPIDEMQDAAANEADEACIKRARAAIAKATGKRSPVATSPSNAASER